MVLGLVLLGLAVGYAVRGADFTAIAQTPPWVLAALLGLVAINLLVTAGLFWSVTRSFTVTRPVGYLTMAALVAVSGVLNYIPLIRAGLWGRAAYLKKFHGLAVRDSLITLGVILGLSVAVLGTVSLMLLAFAPSRLSVWACGGALAVQTVLLPWTWGRAKGRLGFMSQAVGVGGAAVWWVPLRALDLAAAAGRLWLVFGVLGFELLWTEAVLLASANLVVKLVGLTPNGLGLSEWVVAALSAAMMPIETATAAAAALIDRTAEVLVLLLSGGLGAVWLKREAGNAALSKTQTDSPTDGLPR